MRAWIRWAAIVLACGIGGVAVGVRTSHAAEGRLTLELQAKDRVMTGLYKVIASADAFPEEWLAGAVVRNTGTAPLKGVAVRFRVDGWTEWSPWSADARVAPGGEFAVPYHPLFDRSVTDLQTSTPVDVRAQWRCRGNDGPASGEATRRVTLLGGREFVFSRTEGGSGTFEERFSNAPFLAAWVSRDDPIVKQFAGLASRNAGGAAANLGNEAGLETLRASYELMLLNDFVYKAPVALLDPRLSFDAKTVQNLKLPRDVLRDKSGTCIELAILHAAIAHQLGIRPYLALIPGHCFPIFELSEQVGGKTVTLRVPMEANGIRGGLRALGMDRVGFHRAVEIATANEARHRKDGTLILVDVLAMWAHGVASPEPSPLPEDALERWGIRAKGVPGVTLPEIGNGPALADPSGFGGTWAGSVKARLGGPELRPYRVTLVVQPLRGQRFKLLATFTPEGGGETVQEESVAEDQDGQLVFQGKSRSRLDAAGRSTDLAPGRGAARVEDGRLVGKYGADGEGFSSFRWERR